MPSVLCGMDLPMFLGAFAVGFRECNPHGRKYMSVSLGFFHINWAHEFHGISSQHFRGELQLFSKQAVATNAWIPSSPWLCRGLRVWFRWRWWYCWSADMLGWYEINILWFTGFYTYAAVQDFYHQQYISSFVDSLSIMRYPWPLPQGDWWYQFCWEAFLARKKIKSLKARKFQVNPTSETQNNMCFILMDKLQYKWVLEENGEQRVMQMRRDIENQRCHLYHIPDELFAAAHLHGTRTFPKRCARMADSAVPPDFTKIASGPDDILLPAASRKLKSVVGAKAWDHYEAFVEDTKRLNPDRRFRWCCPVWWSVQYRPRRTRSRERVLSVLMVTASLIGSADSEAQLKMCAALRIHWTAKD